MARSAAGQALERPDIFAPASYRSDRSGLDSYGSVSRTLRPRRLRSHGSSRSSTNPAKSRARPVDEVFEGIYRAEGQLGFGPDRRPVLAERILRSLGARATGVRANSGVYREQPRHRWICPDTRRVLMVQRKRREESRRGTHECVRHINPGLQTCSGLPSPPVFRAGLKNPAQAWTPAPHSPQHFDDLFPHLSRQLGTLMGCHSLGRNRFTDPQRYRPSMKREAVHL